MNATALAMGNNPCALLASSADCVNCDRPSSDYLVVAEDRGRPSYSSKVASYVNVRSRQLDACPRRIAQGPAERGKS